MEGQVMKSELEVTVSCVKSELMKGNRNVFVALTTGYGKSACFQSLSLVYDQLLPKCEPAIIVVVVLYY